MKKDNIFWGLLFILAAVLIIINAMGIGIDLNIWNIIFTVVLIACLVRSIVARSISGVIFAVAFLLIIYDDVLGIERLTPWPVLGAAVLASIGCSMIFGNGHAHQHFSQEPYDTAAENISQSDMDFNTSFTSTVKNVNSDDFKYLKAGCTFGAMKIYFQNAMIQGESAQLNLHVSFAGAELYIPKEWTVVNQVDASFGGIDEKNPHLCPTGGKKLIMTGNVSFGGVEIYYV